LPTKGQKNLKRIRSQRLETRKTTYNFLFFGVWCLIQIVTKLLATTVTTATKAIMYNTALEADAKT